MKFNEYWVKKFGIAGAGPVPNSLLARQDLEGEEREKGIATDDALKDLADDAAVAGTKKEKKTIKSDIISTQKERQLETLRLRGKLNKNMTTFKEFWKNQINKSRETDLHTVALNVRDDGGSKDKAINTLKRLNSGFSDKKIQDIVDAINGWKS